MKVTASPRFGALLAFCVLCLVINGVVQTARLSPRVPVEIVSRGPLPLVVRAPALLEAKSSVTLKAQFDGTLLSKDFHEGQTVKAGELLAVIDTAKIRPEHQEKQDARVNAQLELARARKEVKLQKSLYRSQAVAYSAVEDAQNTLTKAMQAVRAAEEAWQLETQRWNSARVVAPMSGTVVRDGVADDRSVSSGKEILTVADVSGFTLKARVDELDIKRVAEGQPAEARIQIYPNQVFSARVSQIGTQPESADSSAIPVVLSLTDSKGVLLRPKLSADVRIIQGETAPVLSIPLAAIHNADGKTRIWTIDGWGRLRARRIALGQSNPERGEVTEGLKAGERICAMAGSTLAEGMRVVPLTLSDTQPRQTSGQILKRFWHEVIHGGRP